jgi:sugar/nucleoside kinase (ribokinase family)
MQNRLKQPLDYLVIGHVTQDLVDGGVMLGGTVSYASLTAHALGENTGMVTSCPKWLRMPELESIAVFRKYCQYTTTFENIQQGNSRKQIVHHSAATLALEDIPEAWLDSKIVHLGPVAAEIAPSIIQGFPRSFIGLTPQGWMRVWGGDGLVRYQSWLHADELLERADAVVFSIEDLQFNEDLINEYAQKTRVLAVTEGADGARIYWNGDVRHISAPQMDVVDATGAGDIFAAVFFIRLEETKDPWQSGEQAVQLASQSVARLGLAAIPTREEIEKSMIEIIRGS